MKEVKRHKLPATKSVSHGMKCTVWQEALVNSDVLSL